MTEPIRITSHRQFLRETSVPGAVFRGQTKDYGNLIPSFYRSDHRPDLDHVIALANKYFVASHEPRHHFDYRSRVYQKGDALHGGPWPTLPDFGVLAGAESDPYAEPLIPIRVEMPLDRLQLWVRSMTDATAADELAARELEDDERNWNAFAPEAEFMEIYGEPAYALARLQHYGVPTPALDVTYDPYIAAWFATHRLVRDAANTSYYVPHDDEGIVFVLQAFDDSLADLQRVQVVELPGLRAIRQKGGLLVGATREKPDLRRYVLKRLLVPARFLDPPLWRLGERWRVRRYEQHWLFPDGESDVFYGMLLRLQAGAQAATLSEWVSTYVAAPARPS